MGFNGPQLNIAFLTFVMLLMVFAVRWWAGR